jgi:DnaA family protein
VVAAADGARRRTAYLPLRPEAGLEPGHLAGFGSLEVLALDDVAVVAGAPAWERALFRLFEDLRQSGGALVVAGSAPAAESGFRLPDLASRLASGATFRLRPLDDAGRHAALKRRAAFRGLQMTDEVLAWLLNHVARDTPGLFRLLDELDRAALAARRKLTVPFVKDVLARTS